MTAIQTSTFSSFLELVGVLLIFLFILALTYVTTRWIAGYQKQHSFNRNLKLLETLKITTNKYIQLIQAGDEYLVIAVGKDEVHLLARLTKEQLTEQETSWEENPKTESFKEILDKWKDRLPKK